MISHPPRRLIGPPDWLAPGWGVTRDPTPGETPPQDELTLNQYGVASLGRPQGRPQTPASKSRTRMPSLAFAVASCDYRGPIVSTGCQCSRVCWLGHGTKQDGEGFGRVKDRDCGECMKA